MKIVKHVEDIVNDTLLPPGSRIHAYGHAATAQVLLGRLASDSTIRDVEIHQSSQRNRLDHPKARRTGTGQSF